MFLERKKSGLYLGKKSSGKTFLVKIWEDGISEDILLELTRKEIEHIKKSDWYQDFASQIHNLEKLEYVLFHSKFLSNNIDVCNIIIDRIPEIKEKKLWKNYSPEELLYKQGDYIRWWLHNTFAKVFIYNSNHIEGSRIPKEEVEKIIEEKKYRHKVKNEIIEVENSFKAWKYLQDTFVFNLINIKRLYHILTKNLIQETGDIYPRWFKKVPNIAGKNSRTTSPEQVESEMNALLKNYKSNAKNTCSLQSAFDFHLKYEQIHPFENGNGRTGRLIMNKILMKYDMVPMIVFTENKESYSNAISSCSSWRKKKYYTFMIDQYKKTLENSYDVFPWTFQSLNTQFMRLEEYLSKK
jgi:hypothetical protein